ncbi:DUF6396 domain-containing protein [Collimonas silvisoli]|uniref:DUF6396 domain-containing protein n=1 Tax=Collimonas silvisoli TaxID=2825884 RepID=UPI001B8DA330|nr:DUF6396 domain-containing protein [Collimonas silvisoli]
MPRNQIPELFHPHRTEFNCKYELTVTPALDPQAEAWYQEALALDTPDLWKDDRNWPRIIELYTKAAERKHWKAMNNLATLYQTGVWGLRDSDKVLVARNSKAAMALTEDAMRMGVPLAYAVMGNYYADGFVVKRDATAAWAFWQQAADMGSSYAQFTVGRSLNAVFDDPNHTFWGNSVIGIKMLECAFAQSNGDAALALGVTLHIKDKPRALRYLHEGVKFGNAGAANYLRGEFQEVGGLAPHGIDNARADRYEVFSDALKHNPDLRFPNLDKVLPLPPAKLPQWNGKPEDLLNAAKPVMPMPAPPAATPGANLSGRAHIPQGWVLPKEAMPLAAETSDGRQVSSQYEGTAVRFTGYWLPQLLSPRTQAHLLWNQDQAPQQYAQGDLFEGLRNGLTSADGRIMWHYMGMPQQLALPALAAQVRSGLWRIASANPAAMILCDGADPCPQSGVWQPTIPAEHPLKSLVNWRWRQSAVLQGQRFPEPDKDWLVDVASDMVTWQLVEAG